MTKRELTLFWLLVLVALFAFLWNTALPSTNNNIVRNQTNIPERLYYIKDRYHICYAVLDHEHGNEVISSLTTVPCKQVNLGD